MHFVFPHQYPITVGSYSSAHSIYQDIVSPLSSSVCRLDKNIPTVRPAKNCRAAICICHYTGVLHVPALDLHNRQAGRQAGRTPVMLLFGLLPLFEAGGQSSIRPLLCFMQVGDAFAFTLGLYALITIRPQFRMYLHL